MTIKNLCLVFRAVKPPGANKLSSVPLDAKFVSLENSRRGVFFFSLVISTSLEFGLCIGYSRAIGIKPNICHSIDHCRQNVLLGSGPQGSSHFLIKKIKEMFFWLFSEKSRKITEITGMDFWVGFGGANMIEI